MITRSLKLKEIKKEWLIADAEDKTLGRFATAVAKVLRGKHKPSFTPNLDMGDFVIIINAEKIKVSGSKEVQKKYFKHSGYIGSASLTKLDQIRRTRPEKILEKAIWGMLPKNRLGRSIFKHLKIYSGSTHPHISQQPKVLNI
tara:strand:- start:2522 stop:2950 length:429 start_codon:yes stop_codon:yes gene_type:complete